MKTFLLLATLIFISCNRHADTNSTTTTSTEKTESSLDLNVALTFINNYVSFCVPKSPPSNDTNWIRNNLLLTNNFKTTYYNLINSANKLDPELGLGFDPIFDAQDFPEKGFIIINSDTNSGYVTVKGKDWPEFILVLKVIEQNGESLIDGCGVINIPANKKAKR